MSKLKLRVHLEYIPKDVGVIANIYGKFDNCRDLIIPAGDIYKGYRYDKNKEYKEITLKEGYYLIEVMLPSGDILKEDIEIKKNEDKILTLYPKWTKTYEREYLRWQNYIHGWQNPEDLYLYGDKKLKIQDWSSISAWLLRGRELNFDEYIELSKDLSREALISKGYLFEKNDTNSNFYESTEFYPSKTDKKISLLEIKDGPWENYESFRMDISRFYLYIEGDKIPPQYCVLPIPWRLVQSGNMAKIEALISKTPYVSNQLSDEGGRVSVSVRDNLIGSVLGYLNTGELSAALSSWQLASEYGEQLLYDKVYNPYAATAGGYVLLNGTTDFENKNFGWYKWIKNLYNWFPFLPDGAILNGWLNIYQRKEGFLKNARDSFLEAYYRGIPYYSKGVKMLLDGLRIISSNDQYKNDEDINHALNFIQELSLRVDVDQPFTCVILKN